MIAQNTPMLAVARKLHFKTEPVSGDATVWHIRARSSLLRRQQQHRDECGVLPASEVAKPSPRAFAAPGRCNAREGREMTG